MFIQFT